MKNATRQKILDTASALFYQKGYNLTGINEIIRAADIAKATLYSHFKSKEAILLAYLDIRDAESLEKIQSYCASKAKGNARLLAVLEFLKIFFNQKDFNGCWTIRTIAEVPTDNQNVRSKIKKNKQQFLGFLKQLVVENKPMLSVAEQNAIAQHLYVLYEGAITGSHIHCESWPIDTAIRLLEDYLYKE